MAETFDAESVVERETFSPDEAAAGIRATPFRWRDPATIPPRDWLYGRHLIRRFLSLTVAPGAVGKSSLAIVEALAMVTGRPLLGVTPPKRLRVWLWNGEDPLEEIERRVMAACQHFGIPREEIEGRLFIDSGRTSKIIIATTAKDGAKVAEPVVDALVATMRSNRIDVLIVDPLVKAHRIVENDNGAFDLVAGAWAGIGEEADAAVELIHHVRKGQGYGEFTVEDGRGGGALLAASRSARVLNPMRADEAEKAGVRERRRHFRVDNGKANLAPPPDRSDWYRLVSVDLGQGDHVAVVEPWQWPDPLADMTVEDLRKAQRAAADGGPWRASPQAQDWVGVPIAAALGIELDRAGKAKVRAMLKTWVATEMFVVVSGRDDRRKPVQFVEVGEQASD